MTSVAVGASLSMAAAGSLATEPPDESMDVVRMVEYAPAIFDWCYHAAREEGFFADESIAIAPDPLQVSTNADLNRALLAGEGDLSLGTIGLLQTYRSGEDPAVRVIAGTGMAPYSFVGRTDRGAGWEALDGATIAVNPEGEVTSAVADQVLDEHLGEGNYELLYVGGGASARLAAVQNGQADAAILTAPIDQVALQSDEGLDIIEYVDGDGPRFQIGVVLARSSWLEENHDVAVRWMRAYLAACDWVYDPANRDEAIALLAGVIEQAEEPVAEMYDVYIDGPLADTTPLRDGRLEAEALRSVAELFQQTGSIDEAADLDEVLSQFIDTTVLDALLAEPGDGDETTVPR